MTTQDVRIARDLITDRDVRAVRSMFASARSWEDVAKAAIHQLAAREVAHEALRVRYGRLLDEYQALRQQTPRQAA